MHWVRFRLSWFQCSNLVMMCCDFLRIIKSFLLYRLNIFLVLRPHCLHLIVMLDYTLGHLFGSLLSRLYRKYFRVPFCIGFELGFRGGIKHRQTVAKFPSRASMRSCNIRFCLCKDSHSVDRSEVWACSSVCLERKANCTRAFGQELHA